MSLDAIREPLVAGINPLDTALSITGRALVKFSFEGFARTFLIAVLNTVIAVRFLKRRLLFWRARFIAER